MARKKESWSFYSDHEFLFNVDDFVWNGHETETGRYVRLLCALEFENVTWTNKWGDELIHFEPISESDFKSHWKWTRGNKCGFRSVNVAWRAIVANATEVYPVNEESDELW